MADTSDADKRRHHRVACNQVHRIAPYTGAMPRDDEFVSVVFNDISKSGFSFFADRPPEATEIVLSLDFDPPRRIAARIVNHRPEPRSGRYIVGCAFTGRLDPVATESPVGVVS
jgi:hypothetical protein